MNYCIFQQRKKIRRYYEEGEDKERTKAWIGGSHGGIWWRYHFLPQRQNHSQELLLYRSLAIFWFAKFSRTQS